MFNWKIISLQDNKAPEEIDIQVSSPQWEKIIPNSWSCFVQIPTKPIYSTEIFGSTTLQAVSLAIDHVRNTVKIIADEQYLLEKESNLPILSAELISHLFQSSDKNS
jgi:hypothetical protein